MIYPSIYNFNAPYRGPKEDKEIKKLFTSITHDISVVFTELEAENITFSNNLKFCVSANIDPPLNIDTAAVINDSMYSYQGITKLSQSIDNMQSRINQILENL
jgi:hypothetical protein